MSASTSTSPVRKARKVETEKKETEKEETEKEETEKEETEKEETEKEKTEKEETREVEARKVEVIKWPKILLLGDSQTQMAYSEKENCWVAAIADRFQRKCDVVNRGFYGYNSRWVKLMLPQVIDEALAKECAAVTLFLGSNDANSKEVFPRYHVPLDEYKASLKYIVKYLMDLGIDKEKIILISAPPVDEELWTKTVAETDQLPKPGLSNDVLGEYAKACCEAASELNANSLDLFTKMLEVENWKRFVNTDGLHLSKEGGQLLAELLMVKLESVCQGLKQIFPHCEEVDYENPSSVFPIP